MATLAAYSFDESGSTVVDQSGNGKDFTLTGTNAARDSSGRTNGGLTKTTAGGSPALPLIGQTASRTVMAWVRGLGGVWWIRWHVLSIDSGAWGLLLLSGSVGVQARNASGFVRPSVAAPTDGLWHHYAGSYDGTTVRLYVDGVLAASAALTAPLRTDADVLDIAHWSNIPPTTMDDLRIIDTALTAAEITTLMGTPVAPAPTGVTGALSGALPAVTGTTSGTVTSTGQLGGSLPPVSGTGFLAASIKADGALAATLPAPVGGITAQATAVGGVTGTLPTVTGVLTGNAAVIGDLSGTLPALVGAFSGATVAGQLTGALPAITGGMAATLTIAGILTGVLPAARTAPPVLSGWPPLVGAPTVRSLAVVGAATARTPLAVIGESYQA